MSMTPGLAPNLRLVGEEPSMPPSGDVQIEMVEEQDEPRFDKGGNLLEIEHSDGSITISLDGKPIEENVDAKDRSSWFRNLVDDIDAMELSRIADDLLKGVQDDMTSRTDWIEDRAHGMKLLGLKIELPALQGATDGAPVEGMSRIRHPLLLEAVLRFQANARAELLPTDGPVKIRNDTNNSTLEDDQLANALERDMNHYLTAVAKEYYPDTDRMLMMLGFGGSAFKKIYFCPLRGRPVSESVDADDLIVNNCATDLSNAKRITHKINMRPSTVRRMQILGVYRDVDLTMPSHDKSDSVEREKAAVAGVSLDAANPEDRDRLIYECYCELDIAGYEHKRKGKITGLEIPYRVTIDESSREILSIVRNYNEDTKDLPESRSVFVKYTFVPGFGFYDIGLLHILGNTTNAITAAWRELLDAGMYANFPGFLFADSGLRQNTNIFRVPPGGGAPIKTGGMPINQAIMPLPYKEPSAALMNLAENIAQTGARVGGTAEMAVGEGRADAPVGTTIALIDQAQKVLNSVHKRMHAAQADEFQLLLECFKENPESFWERNRKPAHPWDETTFMKAVNDFSLVPQADPNTASHTQRLMKIMGLKQLQQSNPGMYDPIAVDIAALQAMGWSNPSQFMAPMSAQGKMPPEMQAKIEEIKIKQMDAASRMKLADAKTAEITAKIQNPEQPQPQGLKGKSPEEMQSVERMKLAELQVKQQDSEMDNQNRAADRESRERLALLKLIKEVAENPEAVTAVNEMMSPELMRKLEGEG